MMNHTEMMNIKREEEMAQAQHEFNMNKINQEMLETKAGTLTCNDKSRRCDESNKERRSI